MTKQILVTGAAGFIGAEVCRQLLLDDQEVVGIDNLNDYYDVRLKEYRRAQLESFENFRFEPVDIEDRNSLERLFSQQEFESVINLAARAGVRYSMVNPTVYFTTNVLGSLNLLELCRHHAVGKYVLASTSSLYAGQPIPFSESLPVNEPISPYAASKKAAEVLAYTYHRQFGIDVSVLRYFTVYGPAGRPDMSPFRFVKWVATDSPIQVFGDGTQSRDFTFVEDIARGTILALRPLGFEIINLGGDANPISINQMISEIEKLLGKQAVVENHPFHQADMKETCADISKARELLGWEPEFAFAEGLKQTVDWYRENLPWSATLATDSI